MSTPAIPVSCNFPSCIVSLMTSAVPETNWPLPTRSLSPSDLGNIREEYSESIEKDSDARAGRIERRKAMRPGMIS